MSNWSGELSDEQVAALKAAGIEEVVVRLSLEDEAKRAIAVQQLRACVKGELITSGYLWLYSGTGPMDAHNARALAEEAGAQLRVAWLDAEDTADQPNEGQALTIANYLLGIDQPVGLYTAQWFLSGYWGMTAGRKCGLSHLPLWLAQYDGGDDLAVWTPSGGWTELAGKQYAGTMTLAGIPNVDLDVFRW